MNKNEICCLCTEYDKNHKCENENDCKLISLWKENKELKIKIAKLNKELFNAKVKKSFMINPNIIGNKNDMGW